MTDRNMYCPIWGEAFSATVRPSEHYLMDYVDSPRSGGKLKLYHNAMGMISELSSQKKAQLTSWIIDEKMKGIEEPEITADVVKLAVDRSPLLFEMRADRLLSFINEQISRNDQPFFSLYNPPDSIYTWSESTKGHEIGQIVTYLVDKKLLSHSDRVARINLGGVEVPKVVSVSGDGQIRLDELRSNVRDNIGSSQAFVAMWIDDSMKNAYEEGIKSAITKAGYSPYRVDDKHHLDAIEAKALAEIHRSRFLVVDFTHDHRGARGSVYFEAGFAHALNKPIIYTCRYDQGYEVHFDVDHYLRIEWRMPEDLSNQLLIAIKDTVGLGPLIPSSPR